MYRFPWYLTLVSTNHASSNPGQIFKKPLDIFSPQIERKRFKEYLVIILTVKERFERFPCLEFVFEKSKHREAGLKHKIQL